ncbi:uncharacterized protein EI90DRAFT_3019461 [Cantharellus anzutake]|uniref:uncharacterized protein n=1 Tax=Cantharellus anzutake TaxID=1750568 RepID=UPI001908FF77|nr:uncharacterized protein EI90DRAFT_3019461 [Cantharellus anzutake]KAF8324709.1 hypothetical protein EI90DRAFT_3019461 [Cantharellus anzutake]
MTTQPGGSRQPTRGRPRRTSFGAGQRSDSRGFAASSSAHYDTRDASNAKRYPSEYEDWDVTDDGRSIESDGPREPGSAKDGQSVLNLSQGPRPRRTRTLMTSQQLTILHALLAQTRFPTTAQREEAARQTVLTPRKVQVWFQNEALKRAQNMYATAPLQGDDGPSSPMQYAQEVHAPHSVDSRSGIQMAHAPGISLHQRPHQYSSQSRYHAAPSGPPDTRGAVDSSSAENRTKAWMAQQHDQHIHRQHFQHFQHQQQPQPVFHRDREAGSRRVATPPAAPRHHIPPREHPIIIITLVHLRAVAVGAVDLTTLWTLIPRGRPRTISLLMTLHNPQNLTAFVPFVLRALVLVVIKLFRMITLRRSSDCRLSSTLALVDQLPLPGEVGSAEEMRLGRDLRYPLLQLLSLNPSGRGILPTQAVQELVCHQFCTEEPSLDQNIDLRALPRMNNALIHTIFPTTNDFTGSSSGAAACDIQLSSSGRSTFIFSWWWGS